MALFEKKTSVAEQPEVAACEKNLLELEGRRTAALTRIGEIFLENATPENVAGTPYEEKIKEINAIDHDKEFQKKRMLAVQGKRECEKCGNILVLDSVFCNKCGEKLEPLFAAEVEKQQVCPQCGASYGEGASFCTCCGYKLN